MVDHNDYASGFYEGYALIAGNNAARPALPAQPATPAGKTRWQVGFRKGLERAGVQLPR